MLVAAAPAPHTVPVSNASPLATLTALPWRVLRRVVPHPASVVPQLVTPFVGSTRDEGVTLRSAGADVPLTAEALARAFPHATERLLILVPGCDEDESVWRRHVDEVGGTYASRLAALLDWTPVHLQVGPAAPAIEVAAAVQTIVDAWPVAVRRITILAHRNGGLVVRAACGVSNRAPDPWHQRVGDVVLLDTPHLLAPSGRELVPGVRGIERELAGIVCDERLQDDTPAIESARYTVIVPESRVQPSRLGGLVGGLLWWRHRLPFRPRGVRPLFPTAQVMHVPADRIGLANHPEVHRALLNWLA